jgi:5S rRNA maturation endonuclease (ribonuclease M5)
MKKLNETVKEAARRFSKKAINDGFQPEALHEYTDSSGNVLHWRIRLKNPNTGEKWIRPMRHDNTQGYLLEEPNYLNGKPLYNLHQLSSQEKSPVIVVEGEWCVDRLARLGALSTTSGGADSVEKTDLQPLAGRLIILWPDNDEPGKRFAETFIKRLKSLGCEIRQINTDALNLPEKGDAVDWLEMNANATIDDILKLPTIPVGNNHSHSPNNDTTEDEPTEKSQTTALVDFTRTRVKLFHDNNSAVYAQDISTGETKRLDGRQFKDWLIANFYESTGKSPREQSVREALNTLSGLARYRGECCDVHIRTAHHDGKYYLDLGEPGRSRVVCISSEGWKIIDNPPVCFLRPETLQPLPEPIQNSDISSLWNMVNISEHDRLLIVAWLIDCLRPETPFPVLEFIGEQGSAKSTTQKMLRRLIDPNSCDLRAAPKTIEDIFVSAGVNWLVSYENISHLSPQVQDALCVLATGGGFAKRKLYTDADESVILVKRPVVLNGISAAVTAQDLIDRTISIETPLITLRTEITDLWNQYKLHHASLLGALLGIFSESLARLKQIELPQADRPRLAEFAKLGMAIAETLGKTKEDFLAKFNASRQESIARTIDASPVASALIEWFEDNNRRTTVLPVKQLFFQVERKKPLNTDSWPRSAKGFADALRRIAPALRCVGIECRSLGKTGSYVSWEIKQKV